jgi:hypothetical protein
MHIDQSATVFIRNGSLHILLVCDARRRFSMRYLMSAALVTAALGGVLGSSFGAAPAFAQSGYVHHNFCLLTGPARECAYQTFEQCLAAKRGNADFCEPNGAPLNHAPSRYQYQ